MSIKNVWDKQYSEHDDTALKDRNLFELESKAIKDEIRLFLSEENKNNISILELGSGTGFLAKLILDEFPQTKIDYTGVDFSAIATQNANKRRLRGVSFIENDFISFLQEDGNKQYDVILTQRSIMAVMEEYEQNLILELVANKINGMGLFSECTADGFKNINNLRKKLDVGKLEKVWHSKYLENQQLDKYFPNYKIKDFSSMYYLITRVLYPMFEEPKHNTSLADFAASLKQDSDYSFLKLIIVKMGQS